MPGVAQQAVLAMGGFFVLLGIILIIWNRREKKRYYDSILLTHRDIKESLTHDPERSWLSAWHIGGTVSFIVGIALLVLGGVLWLIGR